MKYLGKKDLAKRYKEDGCTIRTVERMIADGRLPPPDLINGRFPLWDEEKLAKHERMYMAADKVRARNSAARAKGVRS
jgi:hypothetical protein